MQYLNDTAVSDKVYGEVQALKRKGGKVFLVLPELLGGEGAKLCTNCAGIGKIGIQVITGGPYEFVPAIQVHAIKLPNGKEDIPARATWIDGKWYKQKTRTHDCPVCSGTGAYVATPGRAKPLAL